MSMSEKLFEQAQKVIPGGVNSPVRAFKGVGVRLFLLRKQQVRILSTATTSNILTTLALGARWYWGITTQRLLMRY